ncbi:MAG: NOB1 family endonuclease [Nitrososphaera sp.]
MPSSLVLDAGAFYAGTVFMSSSENRFYTTEKVFNEIKHIKSSYAALEVLLESGRLQVIDPEKAHVDRIVAAAKKTGDNVKLSPADLSVIALASQLGSTLVTDDYAASNVANAVGVSVSPATPGKGIKEARRWLSYCSACSRTFDPSTAECPICGNKLKRKYRKA